MNAMISSEAQKFRKKVIEDVQRATGPTGWHEPMIKKLSKRQFQTLTKKRTLTLMLNNVWWTLKYEEDEVNSLRSRVRYLERKLKERSNA